MRRLVGCLLLVSACATPSPVQRRAAEPAQAPQVTVPPAGRVVQVGAQAEGVAIDPVSHVVAVGVREPYGLALVDAGTGRLLRTVPLPGHVRHLASRGSQVLVPVEDAGQLLAVALPSGSVVEQATADGYPHAVSAVGADGALVGNERGRRVSLVRDGRVVATAEDFTQPGGSAAGADALFVVDVADASLTRLSLRLVRERTVAAGDGPTHAVTNVRGDVLVVDTRGDAVLRFDPSLRRSGTTALPGRPYGVAYDPARDQVWVTLTARNELVRLQGPAYTETGRWPTVRQPNTVAVDPTTGVVVVASRADGTVQLLELP